MKGLIPIVNRIEEVIDGLDQIINQHRIDLDLDPVDQIGSPSIQRSGWTRKSQIKILKRDNDVAIAVLSSIVTEFLLEISKICRRNCRLDH